MVNEGSERTAEEIETLLTFIGTAEYSPTARACIEFLGDVQRQYDHGNLGKLVHKLDTQKLFNIYAPLIPRFIDRAIQGKAERFSLNKLSQDRGGIEEAETIQV